MNKKLLYFECAEGIAGDMTVASLLSLGADEAFLFRTLDELGIGGYRADTEDYINRGILTKRFNVRLDDPGCPHDHVHEHAEEHDHTHDNADGHEHTHDHLHRHEHPHIHRNLDDVLRILNRLSDPAVRELAAKIFRIVAKAEAKVHGKEILEVHFHEVGAVDSIVDIVGAASCIVSLGVSECVLTSVAEGSGTVRCAHGILPVPVPAVLAISEQSGLPLRPSDRVNGERVTPTGAAILAALWNGEHLPPSYKIEGTGYASGHRAYDGIVSILRVMLLSVPADETADETGDVIWKLETNIDDASGEMLGLAMEELFAAGARDVFYTPVFSKKNRPSYMLTVLCDAEKVSEMEALIFRHTTSIGIRKCAMQRSILPRKIVTVDTPCGPADVKCCTYKGETYIYPEYESIRAVAHAMGSDYESARALIRSQYLKEQENPL